MYPSSIVIIRHCEKDKDSDANCTTQGYNRAQKLANYFEAFYRALNTRPDVILATWAGKPCNSKSAREIEMITPTANLFGLPVVTTLPTDTKDSFPLCHNTTRQVATYILNNFGGKHVLVCWDHDYIPQLVQHLTNGSISLPKWEGWQFNLVLMLTWSQRGTSWNVTNPSIPKLCIGEQNLPLLEDNYCVQNNYKQYTHCKLPYVSPVGCKPYGSWKKMLWVCLLTILTLSLVVFVVWKHHLHK
jgi:hypothetical protein